MSFRFKVSFRFKLSVVALSGLDDRQQQQQW